MKPNLNNFSSNLFIIKSDTPLKTALKKMNKIPYGVKSRWIIRKFNKLGLKNQPLLKIKTDE